jgi:Rrf2 family protein
MKLSKKSRYGLRALIDLSVNGKEEQVVLSSIAERNDISPQYLEQVFASLRRAGIVKSVKGPQGGYRLSDAPSKITVAEILEALEGTYHIDDEEPAENSRYPGVSVTIQNLVIDKVNEQLDQILRNVTLSDLEENYLEHNKYGQDMYYI